MNSYSPTQIDTLLDMYFRDHLRPAPWPDIAKAIAVDNPEALDDLLWKTITGYPGKDPHGPRREYAPTRDRIHREGFAWHMREDDALRAALAGEGQLRNPPCDPGYIAAVLARPVEEVILQWASLGADNLGRDGFGFDT